VKNFQQTPKQRRLQKQKLELSKRAAAHSKPHFTPRDSWTSKRKIGDAPLSVLARKQPSLAAVFDWPGWGWGESW
jgi:hypothetical protein